VQDVVTEVRIEPDPEESVFGVDASKLDDLDSCGTRALDSSDEIVSSRPVSESGSYGMIAQPIAAVTVNGKSNSPAKTSGT